MWLVLRHRPILALAITAAFALGMYDYFLMLDCLAWRVGATPIICHPKNC